MPWSGRDALLARWLPQFHDAELARHEADKYVRDSYAPDDARADKWMARALVHDQDLVAIAADPDNYLLGPSRFELNDKPCPMCNTPMPPSVSHCENGHSSERYQCWHCHRFEDEPAAEHCHNPTWHVPHGIPSTTATVDTVLRRIE